MHLPPLVIWLCLLFISLLLMGAVRNFGLRKRRAPWLVPLMGGVIGVALWMAFLFQKEVAWAVNHNLSHLIQRVADLFSRFFH